MLTASLLQYNIQFYNQGLYTDCAGLLDAAGAPFAGSALFEIANNGVDLNKLVIGKPGPGDATTGIMDPALLGTCVDQATAKGWNAGVMVFQVRTDLSPLAFSRDMRLMGICYTVP